ncbi:MAG: hypothetical protein WD991_01800, partial [Candidatus Paceibacterota bacterium]
MDQPPIDREEELLRKLSENNKRLEEARAELKAATGEEVRDTPKPLSDKEIKREAKRLAAEKQKQEKQEKAEKQKREKEEKATTKAAEKAQKKLEKQQKKEKKPVTIDDLQKNAEDFIAKLGLAVPDSFHQLSQEQKIKVVQDLKKRVVDLVKSDAQTQYSEDLKKRITGDTNKFMQLVGAISDPLKKETEIKNLEKEIFEKIKNTPEGQALISEDLILLTNKTAGQEVIISTRNSPLVRYLPRFDVRYSPEEDENFNKFNYLANKFASMPYEWGQETGGGNKKKYEKAKAEYEKGREEVLKIKVSKESPHEKGKAVLEVLGVDNAVQMEQLLNTHPEFEKTLADFERSAGAAEMKKTGLKMLGNIFGKKTPHHLLFAGGFATRIATVSMLGLVAAPVVGAAIGGLRARYRAKDTLEERQVKARHGLEDESKEKVVTTDVTHLTRRLEEILAEIQNVTTDVAGKKLVAQLIVRIEHTQGKIEKGQVNFGDAKTALVNQFNLVNVLNKALVIKETFSGQANEELKKRIEGLLALQGTKIAKKTSAAQKEFIREQIKRGAIIGAGAATGGYLVRWFGEYAGWWGEKGAQAATVPVAQPESIDAGEGFMDRVSGMMKKFKFWGEEDTKVTSPDVHSGGKDIVLPNEAVT